MTETGHITIDTDNILPIIKKWLYSEKEIFLRELVSNASDAIHKLEKLSLMGEVETEVPEPKISINVDKPGKQIRITDTGLGMTADEVKKYITQVAFSGLQDFVKQYEGKNDAEQIIGHFGLGFYSSFMVADRVEIETLSYKKGAEAVRWSCSGDTAYELESSDRKDIGTTITLHVGEASLDLLDVGAIDAIATKYCAFMRYPLYLQDELKSDTRPLWTKSPTEIEPDAYKEFYQKLFPMSTEPLFWIHLNVDYPFKLRGILYFPKLEHELDASQGQVKLYCNQVFVEDNVKELIPEYLTLLKGVIDCPDLPLNVSRSALQKDVTVQKISRHITKKVADKLTGLFKTEREAYESYWPDIHPFVKYAMLRDNEFYDRLKDALVFRTASEKHVTLDEYAEANADKTNKKILYASDPTAQAGYINLLKDAGIDVIICEKMIDNHFLPYVEMQSAQKYSFLRVDAELAEHLKDDSAAAEIVDPADNKSNKEKLQDIFAKHLKNADQLEISVETLKSGLVPAMLMVDENHRRLKEMTKFGQMGALAGLGGKDKLIINAKNTAVQNLLALAKGISREEEIALIVNQIHDLAAIQQGGFTPESMQSFITRSSDILSRVGGLSGT